MHIYFVSLNFSTKWWFRFSNKSQKVIQITIGRTLIWTLSQALLVTRWCVCVFPFIVNPYRQQPTFQRKAKAPKLTADDLLTDTSVRLLFVIPFYCCGGQVWWFACCELWIKCRLVFMLMWDSPTNVCSSVYVAAKLIQFYAHLIQFTTFIFS